VALVHHPLALETGLSESEAAALRASERAALAHACHVVVTSPSTARLLAADFGVPVQRQSIVRPGADRAASRRRLADGMVEILSVGSVSPRKGFDILVAALATMSELPWRLTVAGDRERSPETVAALDEQICRLGLSDRICFTGAVSPDAIMRYYANADLFVLASRFEGYGMAFAEAIAHGLPVVGTTAGAIPETVPAGAGVLVPPDDVAALAIVLRRLIESARERERLAAAAAAAAAALPSWEQSAALFSDVLERLG
jgi:glycosyltransferase involved in cell wall biosynthesis